MLADSGIRRDAGAVETAPSGTAAGSFAAGCSRPTRSASPRRSSSPRSCSDRAPASTTSSRSPPSTSSSSPTLPALAARRKAARALRPRRGAHRPHDVRRLRRRAARGDARRVDPLRRRAPHRPRRPGALEGAAVLGARDHLRHRRACRRPHPLQAPPGVHPEHADRRRRRHRPAVARKLLQHPEYGMRLVGFADDEAPELRADIAGQHVVCGIDDVPRLVRERNVQRVVIAFADASPSLTKTVVRLKAMDVQIDIVPRLYRGRRPERRDACRRGPAARRAADAEAASVLAHDQARHRHRRARRCCC